MNPLRPLALVCLAGGGALALAACIVDLADLSGGKPGIDAGSAGGSTASSAVVTTSGSGSTTSSAVSTGSGCSSSVLDCGGCACPDGGCDVVPLATGSDADVPRGIAVSSDGVFWIDKGSARIVGILAQGSAPQLLVKVIAPTALAVAAGRMTYTALDGLWTCLLSSCDATKVHLAGSIAPGSVQSVAYDGQLVYWADRGDDNNAGNGEIRSCDPTTDCSASTLIADQALNAQGLFLSGDSLFWLSQGNGQSNGSVHKSPRIGAGKIDIAAALVLPTGLAADAKYVYWTDTTMGGSVLRCDHTLGYCDLPDHVAPAAGALGFPGDLAITASRLYWAEAGKGTLSSCPLPGCTVAEKPVVHAAARLGVRHLAVGSSCLFWIDDVNGGTVDKVGR